MSQTEGLQNLPEKDEPAVYVANHQSFLVSAPPAGTGNEAWCCK